MSQRPRIRYGHSEFEVDLPAGEFIGTFEPTCPRPAADAGQTLRDALRNPIGCPSLADRVRGLDTAAILVPGKDRVAGADTYVSVILDELNAGGISDGNIEVTLATGTHARHSDEDIAAILGPEAFARVNWRRHDANDDSELRCLGTTSRGTEVWMDKAVLAADIKILTGRIIPHYFAGFGGGRKALLPGVAGLRTILHNHSLTLDPGGEGIHPNVRPCGLEGNPVHLDMVESAQMVENTFVVNTVLDVEDKLLAAFAGELLAAHEAGCRAVESWFHVTLPAPLDVMIAGAGGSPYDCDFIQALKTPFDVREAIRPGGALLWVGECLGGIKKGFEDWAGVECLQTLNAAVRSNYNLAGHNSILLRQLSRELNVAFWSELPDAMVRGLGLHPVQSLEEGLEWLSGMFTDDFRYGVVPYANVTCTSIR